MNRLNTIASLPADCDEREVFVVDPMLATGGSSVAAIQMLKDKGRKTYPFYVHYCSTGRCRDVCRKSIRM